MRRKWLMCLVLLAVRVDAQTPQQLYEEARAAYEKKDFAAYETAATKLAKLRPTHPAVLANYAGALALNGRGEQAIAQLERLTRMQIAIDLSDHDFDSLRARPDFALVDATMRELRSKPTGDAKIAFTLPQKDLLTEAITFDAKTGTYFLSSVRKRKILRVKNGVAKDFVTQNLHGVNGLGIDAKRRILYATSSPYARVEGYEKAHDGDVALFAFDLDSGKQLARYAAPPQSFFDDLTVAPDGTVYVSDSRGSVLRLRDGKLEKFAKGMRSAQGSAWGRNILYVADYGGAIWAVDPNTGDAVRLALPDDFTAVGIDGLEYHDGTLIAIQNGVTPNRVVRLRVDGLKVTDWDVLAANHERMDEPTIGTIAGNQFVFVASSQGNKFDENKLDQLKEPAILNVTLLPTVSRSHTN